MILNQENLFEQYINKRQNIETVAKIFGVSRDVIKRRLKKYNIHKDRKEIFKQAKSAYNKTMIERYGDVSPIKNEKIKEKIINTNIERYGFKVATQSNEIMNKLKRTNLSKYGTEYVLQNKEIREKAKKTWIEKYGVDNPAKSEIIKEKMRNTSKIKYGVDNPGGIIEFIQKGKQTNIKKYGVDYTGRLKEFRVKAVKSSKLSKSRFDGKRFDSSYERDFYDYCLKNKITIDDMQIPIQYEYKNKKHITFIDFKVKGNLIECKGGHLLKGVFDREENIPIEVKLNVYSENNVKVITDELGINEIRKLNKNIIIENIENFKKRIDNINT